MVSTYYKAWRWVVAVGVLAVILIIVTILLQPSAPLASKKASQEVAATQSVSAELNMPSSTLSLEDKEIEKVVVTDATEIVDEAIEDETIEALSPSDRLTNALDALLERISADSSEVLDPMAGSNNEYRDLRFELWSALNDDPLLIDSLLELFEQDPHSKLGREIAAVLSETASPKAQVLALDMATNASLYDVEQRGAALFMVAEMDGITAATRDGLLANIQQEADSDLLQYSLMGLKDVASSVEDYANVNRVLNEALNTEDANVRRHASYQIGEWATSDEDLEPLRTMALEETDLNARVRAVMSLGKSGFKSTESKEILYTVAQNDENPRIRLRAWLALKTYALSDAENASYAELGERIQLDVEAYEEAFSRLGE